MKIDSKINKRVNESVSECRKVLIEATIVLLKKIGAEQGSDVLFRKVLVLYHRKNDGTMETIVCDRVSYCNSDGHYPYLMVSLGENIYEVYKSSNFMSIDNLQTIYEEVHRVVREE